MLTTPKPHLSSELVLDSAGDEVDVEEDFFLASLSLFRFFFCLLDNPEPPGRGDPGVDDSGVSDVMESLPETELLELLLDTDLVETLSAKTSWFSEDDEGQAPTITKTNSFINIQAKSFDRTKFDIYCLLSFLSFMIVDIKSKYHT